MVPAIFSKKFRSESVLAGSKTRTSTTGTVNNRAIETDLVLILISPYPINHLTGKIPSAAGGYNCGVHVLRAAFLMPEKSTIGNASMAAMQKIPISRDLAKAQEAIPHRIKGRYHT